MTKSGHPSGSILIVDDEPNLLSTLKSVLALHGLTNVITCEDARKVMGILETRDIDALLLDLNMPHIPGRELLPKIQEALPELPVIIISGISEVSLAVECMKSGVFDYLVKPIEKSKLLATIGRALEIRELKRVNVSLTRHLLHRQLTHPEAYSDIIFHNGSMNALLMYIESIAETRQTVLITGETGVGKELVARAIHQVSGRKGRLVSVNVAGYDESMFSDSLFGHLKGAYTGADRDRPGLIEQAEHGTLFLDEIGELRPESQVKLLRLLETREYYPLGSDVPRRSSARIVVATNRDLETEVDQGRFRKDLYYRLKTHHVHIPPLRERMGDLPLLIDHFVFQAAAELERGAPEIPAEVYALLKSYDFPGNIRELRSMIFDAMSRHTTGPLSPRLFKAAIGQREAGTPKTGTEDYFSDVFQLPTIRRVTDLLIEEAMKRSNRNQSVAARMLGITPQALSQRLKRMDNRRG